MVLAAALAAIALLWLGLLARGVRQERAMRPLPIERPPDDAPRVVAIVPARDEAHQIERCLRSLLAQDWPALRVVCVDDSSSDGTAEIAESVAASDPRLTVVRAPELPAGWFGKNHANAQGVRAAGSADWYLFTDADTEHAPAALPSAFAAARRSGAAMVTLYTDLELHGFWERALLTNSIATIVGAFPATSVNDPRSRIAIANGQYILIRRDAYEAAGGHEAIRDRVADDLELARRVKRGGLGLRGENGRALVSVRMYRGLRDIWWGFVKNGSAGAGGPLLALLGAIFLVLTLLPFVAWPWAAITGDVTVGLIALAGMCFAWAQRVHVFRMLFSASEVYALLLPVAQAMLAGILVHSAVRQLSGRGPRWKGREYPRAR